MRKILLILMVLSSSVLCAQTSDSLMVAHLRTRGVKIYDGNSVDFLKTGHDKFEDLFEAVREAKSFIHLEYFNFRNDSIAGLLFHLLAQKAAEGVEVRALYDAFGNSSNNQPIKRQMPSMRWASSWSSSTPFVSLGLTTSFRATTVR